MEETCIFCQIIDGRMESTRVYEDEHCTAFLDIDPANTGHTLVVPKLHAAGLTDLSPNEGGRIFEVAQRVAIAIMRSDLRCEGINFLLAHGKAAGQEVFHVHLHVIPRHTNDKVQVRFGLTGEPPNRSQLERTAAQIIAAL